MAKNDKESFILEENVILEVKNVFKTYSIEKIKIPALTGLSLKIHKGELVAIVGPSGSGKSTLINCLGALDFVDSGQIIYKINSNGEGHDISTMTQTEQKNMRLNKIGLIFQFYNLFPVLTAYENVELPALIAKKDDNYRKTRVETLLTSVGLNHRMDHFPAQLSGGEQQRVTVARSLINDPIIILADEPTGELDTETSLQILKIFLDLKAKGNSILMVTHNLRIAEAADRILTIRDGQIIAERRGGKPIEQIYQMDGSAE